MASRKFYKILRISILKNTYGETTALDPTFNKIMMTVNNFLLLFYNSHSQGQDAE